MDQALKKQVKKYAVMTVIMVIMALAVVKLNNVTKTQLVNRTGQTFETGKVVRILEDNIQEDGMRVGQQSVVVKMTSGVKKGQELTTTSSAGYLFGAACKVGMRVVVLQSVAGNSVITSVYSMDRKEVMIGFVVLYLLALCLVGGLQGVKGALGLIFTFGAILFIYLPVVYMGYSPFWTAVFICAITTAVTMYLIGGASEKTVCAVLGTISGVLIAGITATVFSRLSGITGWNVSDIESLLTLYETNDIQVGGLLFSGLLISTLGAVMDVAMSISSAMKEIYDQNHQITRMQLVKAGMRVGRDMMGTDSNTLILAFAGGSLNTLVFIFAYNYSYHQIINMYSIGIELMQGISASMGVILTVPFTSLAGAFFISGKVLKK